MKHKLFYSTLLTVASLFGAVASADADTNVTVYGKDGSVNKISLAESGVIYFQDNNMVVVPNTAAATNSIFAIASIQKVLFDNGAGVTNVLASGQAVLYPTLATDEIYLANAADDLKEIQILNYAGQIVKNEAYQSGMPISVATLPTGSYILKAGASTFKFQKK